MSTAANTSTPPRPSRPKHQHSKSANQVPVHANAQGSQRRGRGGRKHHGNNGHVHNNNNVSNSPAPAYGQDQSFADNAVLSGEDVQIPLGPRNTKKHTQSQASGNRSSSSQYTAYASLTDSEVAHSQPIATPSKAHAAYAGPTFHASPAPSALPMPKFLSRSVPAKQVQPGLQSPPEEDGSDSAPSPTPSPPSPSRAPISVPQRKNDSPLDLLFNADRAEKARHVNYSPSSPRFLNSPGQSMNNGIARHSKHPSQGSLNAVFPIELDAESKPFPARASPPATSPGAYRSATAPSSIPQTNGQVDNNPPSPGRVSKPIEEILRERLTLSSSKPAGPVPPNTVDRIPSEPSSRMQTPSPFHTGRPTTVRSASNPTTPTPATQGGPDFHYGNRNLSPLFQAAKNDSAKRNSGLRKQITADSPILPQEGFDSAEGGPKIDPESFSRSFLENMMDPTSPRRGSAPQVQPLESPNNRKTRGVQRRTYNPRPNSYHNGNAATRQASNAPPISLPKPKSAMAFIPSSVQAKQHSTVNTTKPTTSTKPSGDASREQELKLLELLNVHATSSGGMQGVRF